MKIGAQLYTVRDFARTTEDFSETLKKVADIGYRTVQVSGTCAYEAEWLRDELVKNGLECVITHTPISDIRDKTEKVCRDHGIFGCRNIGIGAIPGGKLTDEVYEKFVLDFAPVSKRIAEAGYKLFYHNHAFEFSRPEFGSLRWWCQI